MGDFLSVVNPNRQIKGILPLDTVYWSAIGLRWRE